MEASKQVRRSAYWPFMWQLHRSNYPSVQAVQEMLAAVYAGESARVQQLVASGADVDARNPTVRLLEQKMVSFMWP
jgi:hypothetical protein